MYEDGVMLVWNKSLEVGANLALPRDLTKSIEGAMTTSEGREFQEVTSPVLRKFCQRVLWKWVGDPAAPSILKGWWIL